MWLDARCVTGKHGVAFPRDPVVWRTLIPVSRVRHVGIAYGGVALVSDDNAQACFIVDINNNPLSYEDVVRGLALAHATPGGWSLVEGKALIECGGGAAAAAPIDPKDSTP